MNKEIEIPEGYEARIEGNKVIIEPKESEDERVRKEIIDYFHGCIKRNSKSGFRLEQYKSWIAYLEKQKDILEERAKNITANMLEDGIGGIQRELIEFLSNTVNASWVDVIKSADAYAERIRNIIEKQKEQKSRIDACGFPLRDKGESACSYLERCLAPDMRHVWYEACSEIREKQETQQPAEWSKEDLQHESWILECLADGKRTMPQYAADFHAAYNWLKSLRPQPKQEWSEEDVERLAKNRAFKSGTLKSEMIFYRQGVRDAFNYKGMRPHWRPSELQMFALDSAILMFHNLKRGGDKEELQSLYNDLKKL